MGGALAAVMQITSGYAAAQTTNPAPVVERTMYVIRSGKDTFAIERVQRTADSLTGEIQVRGADGLVYYASLGPRADVEDIEFRVRRSALEPRPQRRPFSRTIALERDRETRAQALSGMIPYLNPSLALLEQVVRRARAMGGDSATVPMFLMPKGEVLQAQVTKIGRDSTIVSVGGVTLRLQVDSIGRILGGTRPDQGTTIERHPWAAPNVERAMYDRLARLERYRVESDTLGGASLSTAAARSVYDSAASTRNGFAR